MNAIDTQLRDMMKLATDPMAVDGIKFNTVAGCGRSFNDWGRRGCHKFVPVLESDGTKKAPPGDHLFNDWGRRGCHKFVPVLGRDGTKKAPPRDSFDQPPGEMSVIRGKLADHVCMYVCMYGHHI